MGQNFNNKPLFTLTVAEYCNLMNGIMPEQKNDVQSPIERHRIDGIRGVAAFLNISVATAQKLKNENKIPFYNTGTKVFFFSDEIISALKNKEGERV
jgi:hypothetical protein